MGNTTNMKSSGIEWIGDVPKHWEITTLKNKCEVFPSNVDKKSHDDETPVMLCNYVDVYYNEFIDNSVKFMNATANENEISKYQLLLNDVLITKDSEDPFDIAVPALIKESKDKLLCGYHLSILRPKNGGFDGQYLFWVLNDSSISTQFHREATGITRWAIASRHVKNGIIPFPPKEEQKAIVDFLDKATENIDRIIELKEKQLEKIGDYLKIKNSRSSNQRFR